MGGTNAVSVLLLKSEVLAVNDTNKKKAVIVFLAFRSACW